MEGVKVAAVSPIEQAMGSRGAPAPAPMTSIEVPAEAGPLPLREAASAGDAKALFEVATRYAEGRGMKADMAEAAKWYEKSAELGFRAGAVPHRQHVREGHRRHPRHRQIAQLVREGGREGNASAMHNLAVLYAMGADGQTDNDAAATWFIKAAELGVKDSQFNLGILSAKGVGMKQSLEESYKWFALVAKTGDKDAANKRDEIANALRPEQLERARAASELWKPKALDPEANTVEIPDAWQESRREDRQHRHEEGGPEHPGHPQQERLRGRQSRRRDGRQDQGGDRPVPEGQRHAADRRGRREAGPHAARPQIAAQRSQTGPAAGW